MYQLITKPDIEDPPTKIVFYIKKHNQHDIRQYAHYVLFNMVCTYPRIVTIIKKTLDAYPQTHDYSYELEHRKILRMVPT